MPSSAIRPVNKYFPNGEIELVLMDVYEDEFIQILSTPDARKCTETHVFSQKLETVLKAFELYGKDVAKLYWDNSRDQITANEVIDALNMLPSLESINLSSFNDFEVFEGGNLINLKNLTEIELENDERILNFYAKVLKENSIKVVKGDLNSNCKEFFEKQKAVKSLEILNFEKVDLEKFSFIKSLRLERLICGFKVGYQENPEPTRNFTNFLISSQPKLKVLELANGDDYANELVDDKIFKKVCELSELEELSVAIDEISSIKFIQKLKKLKTLSLKTTYNKSLKLFDELSLIKVESITNLTLELWSFEIPCETYENLAENLPNLKSLRITLGTRHKINFYAKVFKNLESLSIKFGEANNHVSVAQAFEFDTEIVNESVKKLSLTFTGNASDEEFLGMLKIFPNLEVLKVRADFKVDAEFFVKLSANLRKLQELNLLAFHVKTDEEFTPELIESLREISPKLKFLLITFLHQQFRRDPEITFEALRNGLEGVFKFSKCGYITKCTNTIVEIFSGVPDEEN